MAGVEGDAERAGLREELAAGIETSEGVFPAKLVEQRPGQVRLIVTEGKYRMVRRILNNAGHPVTSLHRVRYGEEVLGDLPVGMWRHSPLSVLQWARGLLL